MWRSALASMAEEERQREREQEGETQTERQREPTLSSKFKNAGRDSVVNGSTLGRETLI